MSKELLLQASDDEADDSIDIDKDDRVLGCCWMSQLSNRRKRRPFVQLTLIGAHDAGASGIEFGKCVHGGFKAGPLGLNGLANISLIVPFARRVIRDFTCCQQYSIYDMLTFGVRFLDLRLSFCERAKQFFLTHTFTAGLFEDAINQIARFLDENPEEVVVVVVTQDWLHRAVFRRNKAIAVEFLRWLFDESALRGQWLRNSQAEIAKVSLDDIVALGTRCVLFARQDLASAKVPQEHRDQRWVKLCDFHWPRADCLQVLQTKTAERLKLVRKKAFSMTSMTITPTNDARKQRVKALLSFGLMQPLNLKYFARQSHQLFREMFDTHKTEFRNNTVIQFDHLKPEFTLECIRKLNFFQEK